MVLVEDVHDDVAASEFITLVEGVEEQIHDGVGVAVHKAAGVARYAISVGVAFVPYGIRSGSTATTPTCASIPEAVYLPAAPFSLV